MATPQRLQSANISPSAAPVDTFLNFDANSRPAAPARPQLLPQVKGIQSFQQGGMRDVQGVNALQELSDALKPLSKLYDAGVEMYASNQYQQGQNEILKAAANVNRDTVIKGIQYAGDNRQLSAENPVAGVLMDQANPFRQAGRVNQASQYVAGLAPRIFEAEWSRRGGDLSKLDPADPAVGATRASLTGQIAGYFGLDEFSPGFQSYVAPAIVKADEWFGKKQLEGHVKYQKTVGVQQASDLLTGLLFDPRTNQQTYLNFLGQFGAQFGITGEPQEMIKDAILRTVGTLQTIQADPNKRQQATAALEALQNMPSGITDANGLPVSVGNAYGPEILKESAGVSRDLKTLRDNRVAQATDEAEAWLDDNTSLEMTPQQMAKTFATLRADPMTVDMSDAEVWDLVRGRNKAAQEFQAATFDQGAVEDFFYEQEFAIGSDWDESKASARFRELTKDAPDGLRKELSNRWRSLRGQKERDASGEIDSTVMSNGLKNSTSSILNTILPEGGTGMLKKAQAKGMSVLDYIEKFEGDKFSSIQRIRNYIQAEASNRIRQETAEKDRFLRPEEQSAIITDVMNKTLADDKLMTQFGVNPAAPAATPKGGPDRSTSASPEPKTETPTYYSTTQQVPEAVAKSGKPIYKPSDAIQLLGAAANGSPMPANVKRAAKANGMSTGQFLLKQAELLKIPIPPQMREKVERVARVEQGTSSAIASAAPSSSSPLSYASNALFNILTGSAPAVASTRRPSAPVELGPPAELGQFSRQVSSVTFDTGQSGIDVFFEDKKFPAVLGGRVKEVGFQGGADSGYGHFVVVESIDPATGAPVDVLYSHFASKPQLTPGQQIQGGQVIGRQGGTGRVRSADGTIASIDFLAPAPAGSKSMTPYSNYEQLRRSIAQQLRN